MTNLINFFLLKEYCDTPRPWGLYFKDSATPQMEGLVELHDNILFYLVIILFGVGWILVSIIKNYTRTESPISHKYLNHGTLIGLIWTITPALILILIAFPSFKLLYLMDEVSDPAMSVLAEGHQWYWSYQYPDFLDSEEEFIEFDSYLVPESDLEDGALRMLEVDNRVIVPELTHVRFIVTGADVIHSFACPVLAIILTLSFFTYLCKTYFKTIGTIINGILISPPKPHAFVSLPLQSSILLYYAQKIWSTLKSILTRTLKSYTFWKISITVTSLLSIWLLRTKIGLDLNNICDFLLSGAMVSTINSFFSSVLQEFFPNHVMMSVKGSDSDTDSRSGSPKPESSVSGNPKPETSVSGSPKPETSVPGSPKPETSVSVDNLPENTTTGSEDPLDSPRPKYEGSLREDLEEYEDKIEEKDKTSDPALADSLFKQAKQHYENLVDQHSKYGDESDSEKEREMEPELDKALERRKALQLQKMKLEELAKSANNGDVPKDESQSS